MSPWLLAAFAGLAFALFQYSSRDLRIPGGSIPPAILRLGAIALLAALLLDAPSGRAKPLPAWVALDASASWQRAGDTIAWRDARRAARDANPDSLFLFGDSLRRASTADTARAPGDVASVVRPAVERALGRGHPLVIVTDGELSDPEALRDLPAGSRLVVVPRASRRDVAVVSVEMPRALVAGDTADVRVGLAAAAQGAPAGSLTLTLNGQTLVSSPFDALAPYAGRTVPLRARVEGTEGPAVVRAIAATAGDAEPRNDTLALGVDLSRAASAVFVSTSPDFDARYALSVLRGALAVPTRGYFRVAPGAWRVDGSLAPVAEVDVRRAFREAPVAILHGDTAVFGPPRSASLGPIALITPPTGDQGEWYAAAAPPSPFAAALAGLPYDSLAPISVSPTAPTGQWRALEARRGREDDHRVVVAGSDTPRRVVIVAASGLWRWQFRGGASADAFTALWGSIFDWLAAERADRRAAVPEGAILRAGEPVRWHRGSAADSVVVVALRKQPGSTKDSARVDSLTLRFGSDATLVETPPLAPGIYDVMVRGGSTLLAVNASREWLPRAPRVQSGVIGGGVPLDTAPRLRAQGWVYGLLLLCLCGEWVVRRRNGMR